MAEKAFERIDLRLENDSSMIVCGPSKGGKTTFVIKLLQRKNVLFKHPINHVYWFHGAAQGNVHKMLREEMGVIMKEGMPTESDFELVQAHDIVVLDDLQNEMKDSSQITSLFLKMSHHKRFFVILLQQNIYGDKEQRFRNANVHYWIAFNNPRNQRQIGDFLARMYPSGGKKAIERIFKQILNTEGNYGYLFVDFTPEMRADLRLRSHIFTSPMHIYKVNECGDGGFHEWVALSTLNEQPDADMLTYENMVVVPKARYHSMVGGGVNKNQLESLLEPKKAFAKEAAKELLEYKITPETVSDYYSKLAQFDRIRREFFLPRREPKVPVPSEQTDDHKTQSKSPAATETTRTVTNLTIPSVSSPSASRYFLPKLTKSKAKEKRERLHRIQKQVNDYRLRKAKQPPQLRDRLNIFEEYAKYPMI